MTDDELPVGTVGSWVHQKHTYLERYIDISRKTRSKYIHPLGTGGATYIDLFCGAGRATVKGTNSLVEGSAVVAWKASVKGKSPFSKVFVCDSNPDLLGACVKRLEAAGAPVQGYCLPANKAVKEIVAAIQKSYPYGLHFAFLDPFNLEALDFSIIEELALCKRMDMLIHVSAMDLQRNLAVNLKADNSAFDVFAPGWQKEVDTQGPQQEVRRRLVEFWRTKLTKLEVWPSPQHKLISGEQNQPLYWLLLAASHNLAHEFWDIASNPEGQNDFFN